MYSISEFFRLLNEIIQHQREASTTMADSSYTVYELPGGRCLSLMHLGPYEELRRSYEQIFKYAKEQSVKYLVPSREVYHKGPGMIFRGNPQKYLTEIQLMIDES
jgi:effector-binding domain-containing protein